MRYSASRGVISHASNFTRHSSTGNARGVSTHGATAGNVFFFAFFFGMRGYYSAIVMRVKRYREAMEKR